MATANTSECDNNMKITIIGGFPRSGTRQFADILNCHDDCTIQGEIHSSVFVEIGRLFREADKTHKGKRTEKNYFLRRKMAVLETYRWMSKSNSSPLEFNYSQAVLGFKQPYIENFQPSIKKLFEPDHEELVFFICARNIYDNYLSLSSAFDYSVDSFASRTIKSIESIMKISDDSFFRENVLSLDSFINTTEKADWLQAHLFSPLELEISRERREDYLNRSLNRNKTPSDKRRKTINESELEQLLSNQVLIDRVKWMEDRFDLDLLGKLQHS